MTSSQAPNNPLDTTPWYRQFWPWFIIALPASVVVAGLTTLYIANSGADDLVVTDYYKNGLEINEQLEKQQQATALGLSAEVSWHSSNRVVAHVTGDQDEHTLMLLLSHPLEADKDISVPLIRLSPGQYQGSATLTSTGHKWLWRLEPAQNPSWRLDGELKGVKNLPQAGR